MKTGCLYEIKRGLISRTKHVRCKLEQWVRGYG